MRPNRIALSLFAMIALAPAQAADPAAPPQPAPPVRPADTGDESFQPEVRIYGSERGKVEEYSVRGQVYMHKITPKAGPPYYLIDQDGDGRLETQHQGPFENISVPHWVLLRW